MKRFAIAAALLAAIIPAQAQVMVPFVPRSPSPSRSARRAGRYAEEWRAHAQAV